MRNRVIVLVACTIALSLLPRVYLTIEAVRGLFPIGKDEIVFVDLEFVYWLRAAFIAAHPCVAWFVITIWKGRANLALKGLTVIVLCELLAIYLITVRLWTGGIEVTLY